jgi:transcriptional regulator with XRE-family HTH domain
MAVNRGDAAAARDLGAGLKALRNRAGLSTRQLGEKVGVSAANISNWERAERLLPEERLLDLLGALDASDDERERLLGLRRQIEGPGQLVAATSAEADPLIQYVEHEQVSRKITQSAPLLIPGLLQTAAYARKILAGGPDIETRVALRMGRREILTRRRDPAEFTAYIDTEVLTRAVVQGDELIDLYHHLLKMTELPNVTIRLVPSTTPGYTPMLSSPFTILEFATAAPIVHCEHIRSSTFLWEAEDVRAYKAAAEKISNVAMTPAESAEVIASIVNGLETTT